MSAYDIFKNYIPQNEQEGRDREQILTFMGMCDNCLSRENTVAHVTSSAWVVNESRTRVLMAYHNIYDSWSWTGGHADGENDLLAVALREANEETGIIARPVSENAFSIETLTVEAHIKRGVHVSAHLHMNATYLLIADDAASIRPKTDENKAVKWFGIDEVLSACTEKQMIPVYTKLISRL